VGVGVGAIWDAKIRKIRLKNLLLSDF
jgi:hypothetical protein